MELALAVRDVLLVPRCAGCGDPGSWFCVPCRILCDPVAHDGRIPIRAAGAAKTHKITVSAKPKPPPSVQR